jgi:hypothetical protein
MVHGYLEGAKTLIVIAQQAVEKQLAARARDGSRRGSITAGD